jgi:transcriptional regulator GlxA family with amidase domain
MESPTTHGPAQRVSLLLTSRPREPWSVLRLASTVGVSSRTLHRVVRRECGVSPMALLRRARMADARALLEAAPADATVTRVALDCGFAHLGRFSQDYAAQFGESPSETLRRARRQRATPAGLVTLTARPDVALES